MRALAVVALCACGSAEPPSATPAPPKPIGIDAAVPEPAPTLRLPDGVTPLAYNLRLELGSTADAFKGSVTITLRLDRVTRTIWLHASELTLAAARSSAGAVTIGTPGPHDLLPLELAAPQGPGELTLTIDYTGAAQHDQEGLFRQGGFMFSQAEAAFARRFVPCFDEPRFKAAWRVTLVTPKTDVALANAPAVGEKVLPDGRREVTFAEIAALPSYLVAVAAGPFAIVDAGKVGRAAVPLRIAVHKRDVKRTAFAVRTTPKIVDALERYFDQPLPLAKLDLLAVPELFGAMEHPGLVTFSSEILLGSERDPAYRRRFIRVCAHELAHQWMGNLVTPAWWDDLWLAEAFATFLGDKAAAELGAFDDEALRMQIDREDALAADAEPVPSALHRAIAAGDDIDDTFDAIAYEKGRAVLVMFERFVGADAMRTALRAYVAAHAGKTATTEDFAAALAGASSAGVGNALVSLVQHAGTPVVELSLRCTGGPPAVIAHARDGVTVPVCVRTPAGSTCALAGDRAELPQPACPAWLVGNDGGTGYYQVVTTAPPAPLASLTPAERLAGADDVAGAVRRGELAPAAAAVAIQALIASKDPYAELGAVSIAQAIDPLVGDAERAAWSAWLGKTFAAALTAKALFGPAKPVAYARREALLALVPGSVLDRTVVARARKALDRELAARDRDPELLGLTLHLAGHAGGKTLWAAVARVVATDEDAAPALLEAAPALGPAFATEIFAVIQRSSLSAEERAQAVVALLVDPGTRDAAWKVVAPALPELMKALEPKARQELVEGLGGTCSATIRDALPGTPAVTQIDRCLARRAAAGPVRLPD